MADETPPLPLVQVEDTQQVASRVYWIPDNDIEFVPNCGVIVGDRSALVVDTGMGPRNGEKVLAKAREIAGDKRLYLTVTHFHPEHGFGAQSFVGEATTFYTAAQHEEFTDKNEEYLEMFKGFGPHLEEVLNEVEFVQPDFTTQGEIVMDLGGTKVVIQPYGPAHTRGDLTVYSPDQKVVFAGDLVLNNWTPILPDGDSTASGWLAMLHRMRGYELDKVVGGHGKAGGPEIIDTIIDYFEFAKKRVAELSTTPQDGEKVAEVLVPEIRKRCEGWNGQEWVPTVVDSFHRELSGA